jgi:hypothetical protein
MSFLLSLVLAFLSVGAATPPVAVFATWDGDPTTSVSIDWHQESGPDVAVLEVRGPGLAQWTRVDARAIAFPHSTRTVRRARVAGLQPDATYEMRIGETETFRYRTMPAVLSRPVVFAAGGDTQADDARFGTTNRAVVARDVDFVLIGGDLAYSNGDPRLVRREEQWFETASTSLRTRDGRLVPLMAAIGNHEVFSNRDTSEANVRMIAETGVTLGAATYYSVLHAHAAGHPARDAPNYRALDVGDYLSIVMLDTDHTAPVAGAQSTWLRDALAARAQVPWVFPIYHVPGYPSVRSYGERTSARVREHWAPLFDAANVRVAFENHDHAYKRTHPLRGGQVDSSGVIYLGDGAWGAGARAIGQYQQDETPWYLARAESVNHAIIVTLDAHAAVFEVIESTGTTIDRITVARPGRR